GGQEVLVEGGGAAVAHEGGEDQRAERERRTRRGVPLEELVEDRGGGEAVAVEDEAGRGGERDAARRVQRRVLRVPAPAQAEGELRAEAEVLAGGGVGVPVAGDRVRGGLDHVLGEGG